MIILKLGGSAITMKSNPMMADYETIERIASEISRSGVRNLIIVHGGGSFGHYAVSRYGPNRESIWLIQRSMRVLNQIVLDKLVDSGLRAISIDPANIFVCDDGLITSFYSEIIDEALGSGIIPVLFGQAVLDKSRGVSVLSGDRIVKHLSILYEPERVLVGLDVDGVFDRDPKLHPDARLIRELRREDLSRIMAGDRSIDVTGGILGKLRELIEVAELGIEVELINVKKEGNLLRALRGERGLGTRILRG